jgi:ribosomal protein S18 acetylase RimI-like enzyme
MLENDIIIRKATFNDLETLLKFEQAIIEFERTFDPTLKASKISYYDLKGMIPAKDVEVLVATDNGNVVASGYAHIMQSEIYLKHNRNAYLGFMYVIPVYRGLGINGKLTEQLIQWSRSKGISEVRLDVYSQNEAALKAYRKVGFSSNLVEMRLDISQ